jgi:ATP-dependent RNA helicase RhlE
VVLEHFIKLGIAPEIIEALSAQGYTQPTPIQEQAIPAALAKNDILGTAQTGTGKTAAFSIPIIQQLMGDAGRGRGIKALILTPTRELALQIDESIESYSANVRLKHAVIFGGVGQQPQVDAIKRGVDIMTATPGRLLDLMQQGYIDLRDIQFFVLDEADRMLDMGFIHDVKKVIAKLPTKRQTLFFSATMPAEVVKLSQNILVDPVRVSVAPVSTTAEKVTQSIFYVDQKNKRFLLRHLLDTSVEVIPSVLVFTRTKHGADKVVKDLVKLNITAQAIHGNKSQSARQSALSNFKNRTTRVLVATDIAARGIDIDELTHVINYEIPNIPETYVHRIGRTGRAGNSGVAWSFVDREEVPFLRDIQKLIQMDIPVTAEHPFLPGTHVAEANDAKPFYNDGNNGNQRVARKKENLRQGGKSAAPARRDSSFSAPARNERRDQPVNDAPKQKPKSEGPPKPFTRFKPRD